MVLLTPAAVSGWPAGVAAFGVAEAEEALAGAAQRAQRWRDTQERAREAALRMVVADTRRLLAHDVRSPLGVVLGHAQLIRESLLDRDGHAASGEVLVRQVGRLTASFDAAVTDLEGALARPLGRTPAPLRDALLATIGAPWGEGAPLVDAPVGPRVWDRGGALGALLECVADPVLGRWSQVGVTVGPGRVVLSIVYSAPSALSASMACATFVRTLGGHVIPTGHHLRVELPGDDGRLTVGVHPGDTGVAAVAASLRALGARVTDDAACADVALQIRSEPDVALSTCLPLLVLGSASCEASGRPCRPCLPAATPPDQLLRLLRVMASQPRAMDVASGAALHPPLDGGSCVRVEVESTSVEAQVTAVSELVRCAARDPDVRTVVRRAGGADVWARDPAAARSLVEDASRALECIGRHISLRMNEAPVG